MLTAKLDIPRIESRLERLYGDKSSQALQQILSSIDRAALDNLDPTPGRNWDQRDVVLIAYGDQVSSGTISPLQTFCQFLADWQLPEIVNTVHFLPCFPFTSDDGFSVVDYRAIDTNLGTWEDIHEIGKSCKLMLDFVVNHVSQRSSWFRNYLEGNSPYDRYFIEVDPSEDLSPVTRPRSLPLLSDFETSRGTRWVWTTFSRDQVDLNYAEPAVLAETISILLEYASHGAAIIRLDAIAYLWKRIGTNCIHLPETHEVVKLVRDILQAMAPNVLLLTETNVPHDENVSYFGDGDEAHMVYQFSLPPLLLDAFLNEDALPLKRWLASLECPPDGTTYFNFTASHDGVGVRPLEGHVDSDRLDSLVRKIRDRGGLVSTRRQSDGSDSPYELNISYVDATAPENRDKHLHVRRFLSTQAVMLALQGIPAIYFHSLVGTQNYHEGVESSGIPRRINRRKFAIDELSSRIRDEHSLSRAIFEGMRQILRVRIVQPAFSPNSPQRYVESHSSNILCFERSDPDSVQSILVAVNFGDKTEELSLPPKYVRAIDLLDAATENREGKIQLESAQTVWLEARA